jgi:glutamyl-tRNA reductase
MIRIINIGMNHESAPVELRECLADDMSIPGRALSLMRESKSIKEGYFLSTCNRVETVYTTDEPPGAKDQIVSMMSDATGMAKDRIIPHLYQYEDLEAVRHLFRVASSLDSMVMGEPQILGQVKEAYHRAAVREKTTGVIINRLMHRAFHVAKRVRTETGIADNAVSISYAAVELAKKIFYGLEGRKVLLVGAGEMAELASRHLMGQGVDSLVVANRNFERGMRIAESFGGKPVLFEELESQLSEADIVITSTASTEYIITADTVKKNIRKRRNRPLFFIDIAVPRDVEPRVNDLENVFLYDIDDLKEVVEENSAQRKQEALIADRIIEEEVIRFGNWLKTLDVVPTIVSLKDKIKNIREAELKKSISALGDLTPSQIRSIEKLTLSLTEKIINDPILALKKVAGRSTKDNFLDVARKIFNLDEK